MWTRDGGFLAIGRPETSLPTDPVIPSAITGDGTIVYGHAGNPFFTLPTGFVWTEAEGSRAIQPLLAAGGVKVPEGAWLARIFSTSNDGAVIVGNGYDAEFADAMFVVVVDPAIFKAE